MFLSSSVGWFQTESGIVVTHIPLSGLIRKKYKQPDFK